VWQNSIFITTTSPSSGFFGQIGYVIIPEGKQIGYVIIHEGKQTRGKEKQKTENYHANEEDRDKTNEKVEGRYFYDIFPAL
jgi:hypothetical protein